jgi:hypothetical protein
LCVLTSENKSSIVQLDADGHTLQGLRGIRQRLNLLLGEGSLEPNHISAKLKALGKNVTNRLMTQRGGYFGYERGIDLFNISSLKIRDVNYLSLVSSKRAFKTLMGPYTTSLSPASILS